MTDDPEAAPRQRRLLHGLTPADLGRLGVAQVAYVKPVILNGTRAFAIHAADGTPMAVAVDHASAIAAIEDHEMFPAQVH
jgi:hypothetical protein